MSTRAPLLAAITLLLAACYRSDALGDAGTARDAGPLSDAHLSDASLAPDATTALGSYLEVRLDEQVLPYRVQILRGGDLLVVGLLSRRDLDAPEAAALRLSPSFEPLFLRTLRFREGETLDAFFDALELPDGDLVVVGSSLRRTAFVLRLSPGGSVRWGRRTASEDAWHHLDDVLLTAGETLIAVGSRNERREPGEAVPFFVELELDGDVLGSATLDVRGTPSWAAARAGGGWETWIANREGPYAVRLDATGEIVGAWRADPWRLTQVARTADGRLHVATFEDGFFRLDLDAGTATELNLPFRVSELHARGDRVTLTELSIARSQRVLTYEGATVRRARAFDMSSGHCLEEPSGALRCAAPGAFFRVDGSPARCSLQDAALGMEEGGARPLRRVRVRRLPSDPLLVSLATPLGEPPLPVPRETCGS